MTKTTSLILISAGTTTCYSPPTGIRVPGVIKSSTIPTLLHPHPRLHPTPLTSNTPPTEQLLRFHLPRLLFCPILRFYCPALHPTPFSSILFALITLMVSTRTKNKTRHPGAADMTSAAKVKAGITRPRPKRVTKDVQIRELKARLAAIENPEAEPFTKEPLVCIVQLFFPCKALIKQLVPQGR